MASRAKWQVNQWLGNGDANTLYQVKKDYMVRPLTDGISRCRVSA
jgi:hypothetical protein